jgi:SAM-dependent methyltransferase
MTGYTILGALLILFIPIAASYLFYLFKTGVPTFPTMPPMRNKMIEILSEDARASASRPYTIVDLGSGSGQLSRAIALALPEAHVIGIELSPIPWLRSVLRQKLLGPANLEYKRVDFWTYDVSHTDALVNYLMESLMERVSEKLRRELKPGALVVASKFKLRGSWRPFASYDIGLPLPMTVRLYRQTAPAANLNDAEDETAPGTPEKLFYAQSGA